MAAIRRAEATLVRSPDHRFRYGLGHLVGGVRRPARVMGGADRDIRRQDQPRGTRRGRPRGLLLDGVVGGARPAGTPPNGWTSPPR